MLDHHYPTSHKGDELDPVANFEAENLGVAFGSVFFGIK
jgi:hypothetical protein